MDSYTAECLARDMAGADCDPPCPYCGGYPDRPVDAIPWALIERALLWWQDYPDWTADDYEQSNALQAWLEANRPQEGA